MQMANMSHNDSHYRQRVRLETETAARFSEYFGFLEAKGAKTFKVNMNTSIADLDKTKRELSPMHDFLKKNPGPVAPIRPRFTATSLPAVSPKKPSTVTLNAPAATASIGEPMRGLPAVPPKHLRAGNSESEEKTQSSAAPVDANASSTQTVGASDSNVTAPATDATRLDAHKARLLSGKVFQDTGMSTVIDGVDPSQKYRHPQTTSHHIGWRARDSQELRMFGMPHGRRGLDYKRLYGT